MRLLFIHILIQAMQGIVCVHRIKFFQSPVKGDWTR